MFEIIPGILEKDWEVIEKKIKQVLSFATTIQIDIIDGKYASNLTFLDPTPFKTYSNQVCFEAHLMVDDPINYIERFATVGFKKFVGHIEKMSSQKAFIKQARKFGEAGLGVDATTNIDAITVDFNYPDYFLLMSVKAGFSGQVFLPQTLEKIKTLRAKTAKPIEVDGGINEQTIKTLKDIGADKAIVTSSLFKAEDVEQEYQNLLALSS